MKRFLSAVMLLCMVSLPAAGEADAIADAIRQETSQEYVMDNAIPSRYTVSCKESGTVQQITYTAHDYYGNGGEYTKRAMIYLPYGYSPENKYKVLILCHGIGGNEYEWGLKDAGSRVKKIMDNLIYYGDIEPFIVVTPNGKAGDLSGRDKTQNDATQSFYRFGEEIRNDLIPYIEENYSTYGSEPDARNYRAMAGLSMGGMQTINIGMCECLDLFSWFGAFSACPTTYTDRTITSKLADYPINFFYNICGTEDNIAYLSASAAAKNITAVCDRFDESNYVWQEKNGGHDFGIWYLGFYNFARIFGAK